MKAYYEDLWERLPDQLTPPDFALRERFLSGAVRPGDRALDLGCGAGAFTGLLAAAGATPTGVDVAEAALRRARAAHPELEFRLTPADGPLPFEDCVFDVVWASEVIEHIADTALWLSEVRRVLAPRGRLLITTPNHPRAAIILWGIERFSEPLGDHLHLYTRRSLATTLDELGFAEIDVRTTGGPPLLHRQVLGQAVRP